MGFHLVGFSQIMTLAILRVLEDFHYRKESDNVITNIYIIYYNFY